MHYWNVWHILEEGVQCLVEPIFVFSDLPQFFLARYSTGRNPCSQSFCLSMCRRSFSGIVLCLCAHMNLHVIQSHLDSAVWCCSFYDLVHLGYFGSFQPSLLHQHVQSCQPFRCVFVLIHTSIFILGWGTQEKP